MRRINNRPSCGGDGLAVVGRAAHIATDGELNRSLGCETATGVHSILVVMEAERLPMQVVSDALPPVAMGALQESGFVVLAGPYPIERIGEVAEAYDAEVGSAVEDDIRIGSTSTRVVDFVNRGPFFDPLYIYPPLLDAAARIVGPSFKLSSLNARTLRPGSAALDVHVDVERDSTEWPLLGFILMIDAFAPDNGATRFIPGSHRWGDAPRDGHLQEYTAQLVSACGPAGSLLVFNASTWHGQGVNGSNRPRRSLQGAFIPRGGRASTDFCRRMGSETRARLGSVAHHVLGILDSSA
jgi:hypothetical protein